MMRKVAFSILLLVGFLSAQAGCTVQVPPPSVDVTPTLNPVSVPVTGSGAKLDGATAFIMEEHMDATTASGGQPGMMKVSIVPVSAETGNLIKGAEPLVLGQGLNYGFSKDRSQMAVFSYSAKDCERFCLRIIDLKSWQVITGPIPLKKYQDAWFTLPTFDENSRYFPLLVSGQASDTTQAILIDRSLQKVALQVDLESNVYAMRYTPDGSLAVYGTQTDPPNSSMQFYTALLDGNDLHVLWEQMLPEIKLAEGDVNNHTDPLEGIYYDPAKMFSPDGSKLYIVAADKPTLTTVDFQTRTVQSSTIESKRTWFEKLLASGIQTVQAKMMNGTHKTGAVSLDGRYLFVVGQQSVATKKDNGEYDMSTIPLGLQVIDTKDGTLVHEFDTQASQVSLSRDGKSLLLNGWGTNGAGDQSWTEVLDLSTWKVVQRLNGTVSSSYLLDGSQAWMVSGVNSGSSFTIDLYRPGEASPRSHITRSGYVDWIIVP
jgi:hypothetical protein